MYRNDDLARHFRRPVPRFARIASDAPAVDVEMSSRDHSPDVFRRPRSPEPPANDLVEAPRKSLGRGLWGVGRRMGKRIQDVIQKSGGANGRGPSVGPNAAGDEAENSTDDD